MLSCGRVRCWRHLWCCVGVLWRELGCAFAAAEEDGYEDGDEDAEDCSDGDAGFCGGG